MDLRRTLAAATWFFIAALFVDAGNVTDLFLNVDTLHADEDIGFNGSCMDFSVQRPPSSPQRSQPASQSQKNPVAKPIAPKLTIFDQDSPCVAAVPISAIVPSSLYPDEDTRVYTNPITGETLYLKLCTLLI